METLFTNNQYSSDYFKERNNKIKNEILSSTDFSTNEQVLREEIIEKYIQKYSLPKYILYKDNLKPEIKDIKKETPSVFWNSNFGPQYVSLEAKEFIYAIPFEGDVSLSYYSPKRKVLGTFEIDNLWCDKNSGLNYIEISFVIKDSDLEKVSDLKVYIEQEFNKIINPFITNFNNLNTDIAEYNRDLREFISVLIDQRIKKDNLTQIDKMVETAFKGGLTTSINIGVGIVENAKKYGNIFYNYIEDFFESLKGFISSKDFKSKLYNGITKCLDKVDNFKEMCNDWYDAYDKFDLKDIKDIAGKLNKLKKKVSFDNNCISENSIIQNVTELVSRKKGKLTQTQFDICKNLEKI